MKRLRDLLAHAFHVDPPGPAEPTDIERPIIERLCREVVRRRMTTPALLALECSRPMNYLGGQAMHFFQPMASVLVNPAQWDAFAAFLEQRGSIEYLARRLEELESEHVSAAGGADDPGGMPAGNGAAVDKAVQEPAVHGVDGVVDSAPASPPVDPNRILGDRNQL